MFWETPADQYGTWARGMSWLPTALGRPNLLGIASPVLGWASTDRSGLARTIVWQESDVMDYRRFPARPVPTSPPVFHFRRSPAADRLPVTTVPVRQGGRMVERDLAGFLRSTGTTAFLVIKGDTLVSEGYFHGYRHDSTVSSFSVAKPVVSALVGIAIAQGRIGSAQDPSPATCPSWPDATHGSAASPSSTPAHHELRPGRPGPLLRPASQDRGPP